MRDTTWVRQVFDGVDSMDTETFLGFLADDAQFRFGSGAAVRGKDAIRGTVEAFFQSVKALRHDLLAVWLEDETIICQGEVTYTRADDGQVTLPFATIWQMRGGRIGEYLIYIDISPLFAPPA